MCSDIVFSFIKKSILFGFFLSFFNRRGRPFLRRQLHRGPEPGGGLPAAEGPGVSAALRRHRPVPAFRRGRHPGRRPVVVRRPEEQAGRGRFQQARLRQRLCPVVPDQLLRDLPRRGEGRRAGPRQAPVSVGVCEPPRPRGQRLLELQGCRRRDQQDQVDLQLRGDDRRRRAPVQDHGRGPLPQGGPGHGRRRVQLFRAQPQRDQPVLSAQRPVVHDQARARLYRAGAVSQGLHPLHRGVRGRPGARLEGRPQRPRPVQRGLERQEQESRPGQVPADAGRRPGIPRNHRPL